MFRRDRADQGECQGPGVTLLVGGEVGGQHRGPLVVVDPAHADDVGTLADPEDLAPGPGRLWGGPHPEAQDDLGPVGDRVDLLDQGSLGDGVVAQGVGRGVGPPEDRQGQGGLVVGRRVQHRRHRDLADPGHRRGGGGGGGEELRATFPADSETAESPHADEVAEAGASTDGDASPDGDDAVSDETGAASPDGDDAVSDETATAGSADSKNEEE